MNTNPPRSHRQQGFTLLELIIVIVLMGILGVWAGPKLAPGNTTAPAQAFQLARTIRHLQSLAATTGRTLSLEATAGGYRVLDAGVLMTDPVLGENIEVNLDFGLGLSPTGVVLEMDGLGRPLAGGSLASAPIVLTVSSGAGSVTVTVQPVSGFVEVGT